MNKFSSLAHFRQQNPTIDLFTMSWVYAGITAWFSQQNLFSELEFTDQVDTVLVNDWNPGYTETSVDEKKYFGSINEGSPDYWFDISNWHNTTLLTGHEHTQSLPNNNISLGFDRWDFCMHRINSDPRISQEINHVGVEHAKFDLLALRGVPRPHRIQFLQKLQEFDCGMKVLTDNSQTSFNTPYRSTTLGYEQYFNKIDTNKFKIHHGFTNFYDERDNLFIDYVPHKKLFADIKVYAILETTCYVTPDPFLTEKTYKALINSRPFVILGDTNCLKKLKNAGFKTFENYCDESYDSESNLNLRIEKIIKASQQLVDACNRVPTEINEICRHNQQWFFNINRLENSLAKFGKLCLEKIYNYSI